MNRRTGLATLLTLSALLGGLAVSGSGPAQASPRAGSGGWQSYLEQPATSNVRAESATVLSGNVTNARGLTSAGHGDVTLTVTATSDPATVLLDYGVEVEGTPYLDIESYTGTTPVVSLAFSESKTYLRAPGSGTITGDSAFQPRAVSLSISADGMLNSGFMGGFRFEAITLTTPGTVVLHGAGLHFGGGYLATASDYQGYFLSSSQAFNTMFYDGAYTEQTDMQPAGTSGAAQPSVLDGAKRDRAIWSGDLKTFTVSPHPGSLRWAQGAVPTPDGQILIRWTRNGPRFSLTVAVPAQSTAFIQMPGGRHITLPGGQHGTTRTFTS